MAATLAEGVEVLDKAATKTLAEAAVNRGEIPPEDFDPIFDGLPKAEEGAEPVSLDDAKECVLRYAISIGMIPTRLKTALSLYQDELTQPERQIYDFFKNESLTDVTLIHPTTGALYK